MFGFFYTPARFCRLRDVAACAILAVVLAGCRAPEAEIYVQTGHSGSVQSVAFSPDGRLVASASYDNTVKLWQVGSGEELRTLSGHSNRVGSVAFSPDGRLVASASSDNTVKLWQVDSGEELRTLSGHSSAVRSVAFSPDGRIVASASSDNTVKLWQVDSGEELRTLSGHSFSVLSVAFSPDGQLVASASYDRTVKLWQVDSGEELRTLSGHSSFVLSVAFSPDGRLVASASYDATVKLWQVDSGEELRTLSGHGSLVLSVAFSPDGRLVASGSDDATVKLWQVDSGKETLQIVHLPGGDWLIHEPGRLRYNTRLQGDEDALVRFNGQLYPVYPLEWYRDALETDTLLAALVYPDPTIRPQRLRLWWTTTENKAFWFGGFVLILLSGGGIGYLLYRRADPFFIARQFFEGAGFQRIEGLGKHGLVVWRGGQASGLAVRWEPAAPLSPLPVAGTLASYPQAHILYVLYAEEPPPSETLYAWRQQHSLEPVPLSTALLEKAVFTHDEKEVLQRLEEPYLTRTDPYFEQSSIEDPTWFYGRRDYLKQLPPLLSQGNHVGLFGLRKVGKTSLIKQLRRRYNHVPTVFIDCQPMEPQAVYFFEEILRQLRLELRTLGVRELPPQEALADAGAFRLAFVALFEAWKASGRQHPFLLILDEIDKLLPPTEIAGSDQVRAEYVRLFRALRGLAQVQQALVTLVVAYRPDVNRLNLLGERVGENPMFRSYHEVYLGFLSADETTAMIHEIGLWKLIAWDEDAAARVFHYSGGQPLISRFIASHACEEGQRKHVDLDRLEETADELRRTFRRNDVGNYYQEGLWNLMTADEQEVLRRVCLHDGPLTEAVLITAQEEREPLEAALTSLEHFGLVYKQDGKLEITAALFRAWLHRKLAP